MAGWGGARPGAGRPRNSEKYAEPIASFHDAAAGDLDRRYAKLAYLADGGYDEVEVEEVWEPAGLIMVTKEVITKEGTVNVRQPAFPELPADRLVCVQRKRKTRTAAPDRQANQYLVDRVAGKPLQATGLSGPGGTPIPVSILDALDRVYGPGEASQDAE